MLWNMNMCAGWRFKYTGDFWAEMEIRVFDGKNRRIECFARNKFKTNVSSLHLNGCQGHQTVFSVSSVLRLMSSQVEGAHPTRFHFICTNPITPLLVASNLRNYLLYAFSIISIISKNSLNVSVLKKVRDISSVLRGIKWYQTEGLLINIKRKQLCECTIYWFAP